MKDSVRRAIAYIAGSAIAQKKSGSVYDYSARRYVSIDGDVGQRVNVFDYDERCYIDGDLRSLYHYGTRRYLDLSISGRSFSGYDYDTRKHFEGTVSGSSISLYDYEHSKHFDYSL
jgi:hypothetical protein